MELIPNFIKVTLKKGDTDSAVYKEEGGYYEVVQADALLFRTSTQVKTNLIKVPKYVEKFTFSGGSTFIGADGNIVSAEFLFMSADNRLLYHWKQDSVLMSYTQEFDVPAETAVIYAPSVTSMAFIMKFSYQELDVTDGVMNINDLQIGMSRDGTTAVFVSTELPTQFARQYLGFQVLRDEFMAHNVRGNVTMSVYQRSPFANPTYSYTPIISAPVDFSTYKQHRDYIEVQCVDASLNQLISSRGGNDYDILVSDLSSSKLLWKDLPIPQWAKWELSENTSMSIGNVAKIGRHTTTKDSSVAMNVADTMLLPGTTEHEVKGQSFVAEVSTSAQYFFKAVADTVLTVRADIRATGQATVSTELTSWGKTLQDWEDALDFQIVLYKNNTVVYTSEMATKSVRLSGNVYVGSLAIKLNIDNTVSLAAGDTLSLFIRSTALTISRSSTVGVELLPTTFTGQISSGSTFSVVYPPDYTVGTARSVSVIDPQKLMQKFLDLMTGESGKYKATINWRQSEETDYRIRLMAAESIANYRVPYFHGSLKDFMTWMYVMGYEYEVSGNEMIYRPREQVYTADNMIDLAEAELNELVVSPATDIIYATVKAGYDKQDYDDDYLDGLEANALCQYDTGVEAVDTVLDLQSPYRADAIGIQILYRDTETGDNGKEDQRDDTDSDIFVIVMNKMGDDTAYDAVTLDVYDQMSGTYVRLPNALVSAPYLVQYNASLIGVSTDALSFTSTSGNKEAKINDVPINADIAVTAQLFKPLLYEFQAGAGKNFPITTGVLAGCGVVSFVWQGKTLRGFVKDIVRDVVDSEAVTWELYVIDTPDA